MEGRPPLPESVVPPLVQLAGRSMEPSLLLGWRLRVEPLETPPSLGDVVLIETGAGFVVHRVVHLEPGLVFHAGDRGGRAGLAAASAVVGRVTAVLDPPGHRVPALADLPPDRRRAFEALGHRCHAYVVLRRLWHGLGLRRLTPETASRAGGSWLLRGGGRLR